MSEKRAESRPEISVIVPVYKVERYLNECIDSILAQTFTDFELILVDDGSPDNCPALCDAAAAKDSRIRVIHQQNKGLSGARNAGIEIARGNWLSFIDSDDSVDKTFCEKLYHAAKQAGAKLAVSDILYFDADGSLSGYQERALRTETLSREEAVHRIRLTPLVHATTKLYSRELFAELRFPIGQNYEDALTIPAVLEQVTDVVCVGEPLYHYRFNPNGIVRGKIGLKNLQEVYANYALFQCALKYGRKDTVYLQYTIMKAFFRKVEKNLSPEDRKSVQMKQAEACLKKAEAEVKQAGAFTVQNWLEAELRAVNAPLYNRCKYKIRQTKPKKCR